MKARPSPKQPARPPATPDQDPLQSGIALMQQGELASAERCFARATQLDPQVVDAWLYLGHARAAQQRWDDAEAAYRQAAAYSPGRPDAEFHRCLVLARRGDTAAALASALELAADYPDLAGIRHNLATLLAQNGRLEEACEHFRAALRLVPTLADACRQLAIALCTLNRAEEAAAHCRDFLACHPDVPEILSVLGQALHQMGDGPGSEATSRRALSLRPDSAPSLRRLADLLVDTGRPAEAEQYYRQALQFAPEDQAIRANLCGTVLAQGRVDEGLALLRAAHARHPDNRELHANLLLALNAAGDADPTTTYALHRDWARHCPPAPARGPARRTLRPNDKLRLGYVSPDLCRHSVAYFLEPVLARHDRSRFEIHCYSSTKRPDEVTARLRALVDAWHDIASLDDAGAATMIASHEIDLLIDLAGHTANSRIALFGSRPARVQLTWLGYPNTTGLDAIDYRITDAAVDPPGSSERWHSERLLRLPRVFSCYRPPTEAPPPADRCPATSAGRVTFGCFNTLHKLQPAVVACWAELLRRIPDARLALKSRPLGEAATADAWRRRFAAAGVNPDRLLLWPHDAATAEHLARYREIDISLDPFPYNGATTTCESLWMGVPVISLRGTTPASRVGASFLAAVGLHELVATRPEDYIDIAVSLAADRSRLAQLRNGLRDRMAAAPLMDAEGFTRELEDALCKVALATTQA